MRWSEWLFCTAASPSPMLEAGDVLACSQHVTLSASVPAGHSIDVVSSFLFRRPSSPHHDIAAILCILNIPGHRAGTDAHQGLLIAGQLFQVMEGCVCASVCFCSSDEGAV